MRNRNIFNWKTYCTVASVITLAVTLTIGYTTIKGMFEEREQWESERIELQKEIERLHEIVSESASGGAETVLEDPVEQYNNGWIFPVHEENYRRITSPYGWRERSPILQIEWKHEGVDIAATYRAQVVAIADGVVTDHWPIGTYHGVMYRGHPVYGGYIEITHEDGWKSRYAHLDPTRISVVRIGASVKGGTIIGRVGNTGKSLGDHLHFEIVDPDGNTVDPLLYVSP